MAVQSIGVDLRALVPTATGIGIYTRSLLLELAARGAYRNVYRYVGLAHQPPRGEAELNAAGIVTEHEPAPLGVLWQQLKLPRRLDRGDLDLLWSPLLTLPLRCPVPSVVTVHDLTTLLMPETHRLKVKWSVLPFLRTSMEQAARIVTLAHSTARDIAFHFPQCAGKVRAVYPGVDPEFRPGTWGEIDDIRQEMGAPEGYILYAGTLEPRKNLSAVLDAWEALHSEDPQMPPLFLVGPYGWSSQHLVKRIERLAPKGVRHLGHVDRSLLVRLFQGARLFVYPSFYEGFGLPPAEALACGIPTIVSNTSSLPEVAGKAGIQIDPGDTGALALAVRNLLTASPDKLEELRARGIEQAARFRWETAAAEMEEVFGEALRYDDRGSVTP
jgi:glycosyltransferase involved in cell wall biosynthesis